MVSVQCTQHMQSTGRDALKVQPRKTGPQHSSAFAPLTNNAARMEGPRGRNDSTVAWCRRCSATWARNSRFAAPAHTASDEGVWPAPSATVPRAHPIGLMSLKCGELPAPPQSSRDPASPEMGYCHRVHILALMPPELAHRQLQVRCPICCPICPANKKG